MAQKTSNDAHFELQAIATTPQGIPETTDEHVLGSSRGRRSSTGSDVRDETFASQGDVQNARLQRTPLSERSDSINRTTYTTRIESTSARWNREDAGWITGLNFQYEDGSTSAPAIEHAFPGLSPAFRASLYEKYGDKHRAAILVLSTAAQAEVDVNNLTSFEELLLRYTAAEGYAAAKELARLIPGINRNFIIGLYDNNVQRAAPVLEYRPHHIEAPGSTGRDEYAVGFRGLEGDERKRLVEPHEVRFERLQSCKRRMLESGRCHHQVSYLAKAYDLDTLTYFSLLRSKRQADHRRCEDQPSCIAYNVDSSTYKTRHVTEDCTCADVETPYEELRQVIKSGGIPLLGIEQDPTSTTCRLRVYRRRPGSVYVALSHVWHDGLGNPSRCALPLCQLRRLDEALQLLYKRKEEPWGAEKDGWKFYRYIEKRSKKTVGYITYNPK